MRRDAANTAYRWLRAHAAPRDARVAAGLAERVRQSALGACAVCQVHEVRVGVIVVLADEPVVVVGAQPGHCTCHVGGGGDAVPHSWATAPS